MRKITLLLSLLFAITATAQGDGPTFEAIELPSQGTLANGWYQIQTTDKAFSPDEKDKFASCVSKQIDKNNWIFTLETTNENPTTFVYIYNDGNYHIKSSTGKFANQNATVGNTVANFTFTTPDTDKTLIKITGGNQVWCGWLLSGTNPSGKHPIIGSGSSNNSTWRLKLSSADAYINEHYNVYTVEMSNVPSGQTPTVEYNNEDYTGVPIVFDGGTFFIKKETSISPENFTPLTISGYDTDVTIEENTILVTYFSTTPLPQEEQTAIINDIERSILPESNRKVGYLKSYTEELKTALQTFKNEGTPKNAAFLQRYFDRAWTTSNMYLPEDGKVYKISGILEDGTKRNLYVNGNTIKWTTDAVATDGSGYFICQNTADGVKMAAANGSGLISDAAGIVEKGITFHFDWSRSTKFGNVMLIVDISTSTQYRTISVEDNGGMGYYSRDFGDFYKKVSSTVSTDFEFEEVEDYTFPATITEGSTGNYGTLNLPFATTVPKGVTVNKVVASDESDYELTVTALELNEGNVLPAGTPVLLSGDAGTYNFKPAAAMNATTVENTGLQGTLAAKAVTGAAYILALSEGEGSEIKFFLLDGTSNTVNANKAYYVPATASGVRSLALNGGMATAIEGVTATPAEAEAACFDLSGRRVTLPARGLYIVGGKKIFVK